MKNKYRIDKEFEVRGEWTFLDSDSLETMTGKLIYRRDKIDFKLELEFEGDFFKLKENSDTAKMESFENEVDLIGYTNDGYIVVIENANIAQCNSTKNNSEGVSYIKFKMTSCFFIKIKSLCNDQIERKLKEYIRKYGINNLKWDYCKFSFDIMNDWFGKSRISSHSNKEEDIYILNTSNKDSKKYIVDSENLNINIESRYYVYGEPNRLALEEEFYWNICSSKSETIKFKKIRKYCSSIKNLINLFIRKPVNYSFIELHRSNGIDNGEVTAFFISSDLRNGFDKKIDIKFKDIDDFFNDILNNWFMKKERLDIIIENYLSNSYSNYGSNSVILNAINNLEIFHRNFQKNDNPSIEDDDYKKSRNKIVEFIENNVNNVGNKDEFIEKINYRSENMRLRDRLNQLLKELNEYLQKSLIHNSYDNKDDNNLENSISNFTTSLVQTRNYYTHGDINDSKNRYKKAITEADKQLTVASKLNNILKYYIYKELFGENNINQDIIESLVKYKKYSK